MVLQVPSVYHQKDWTICDHILHIAIRSGYGNLRTQLLQLPTCKSASLCHPAATAHPECCSPSRLQPSKSSHITAMLRSLHWLSVAARIRFKVLSLAYTAANKTAPPYLQDIIQAYTPARPLRSAATGRFTHPASHATGSCSSRLWSFFTLAPQWWHDLPIPIGTAPHGPFSTAA